MKRINSCLLFLLLTLWPASLLRPQQSPHDPGGGYVTVFNDVLLENDVVTGVGIGEEDYDGWGHFLNVNTTVSGGGNNRTVSGSASGKFSVAAEAGFQVQAGDEGTYSINTSAAWYCPYVNDGYYAPSVGWYDVYISHHKTYYRNPTSAVQGCYYWSHNCFGSSTPVCGVSLPQLVLEALPCAPTTRIDFLKVKVVAYNVVHEACTPGISFPGAGTGLCS